MEYETQSSLVTAIIDYLWEKKFQFLLFMAAIFFVTNAFIAAYVSFTPSVILTPQDNQESAHVAVEATTTLVQTPVVAATTTSTNTTPTSVTTSSANPVKPVETTPVVPKQETKPATQPAHLPTRIVIDSIGVDVAVSNPQATDDASLNAVLLHSVLRYAGSGTFNNGNMLIMGHSSELPVIHNPLYKVFSKLKTLKPDDVIKVYEGSTVYTYTVTSVRKTNTHDQNAYVSFKSDHPMLTLLTCNVLGEKSDRYLVEANRQ